MSSEQLNISFTDPIVTENLLLPSWVVESKDERVRMFYTREYAENYKPITDKNIEVLSKSNFSNHMESTWLKGQNYYSDWIQVLDGMMTLEFFEEKWHPQLLKLTGE